jgi:hypothetical protein
MSSRRPAKLLPVKFNLRAALAPDPAGRIYRYNAQLTMANPQLHSSNIHGNKQYTLENLLIGDYVSTTGNGRIMKIVSITSVAPFDATVVVEDEYRLNQIQDSTGDSTPWIESQNGIVFEVREGKPVLFPYTEYSTSVIGFVKDYGAELFSRFNYLRQATLVDQYQAGHTFVTGDLITWTPANGWTLMQENDNYIGIVVEYNEPYAGWFRFRPNGEVLDLELSGTGPYFYWDPNNPGKITETEPVSGERYVLAFYKLSDRQAIFFTNNPALDFGDSFVTIGTDQTITGEKTFTAPTVFDDDVTINGDFLYNGNLSLTDLTLSGDLVVNGSTTTLNTTNTSITDQLIELNHGYTGPPLNSDSGIVINRGPSEDNLFFGWDESENVFTVGTGTFTGANTGELTLTDAPVRFGDTEVSGTLDVAGSGSFASATVQDLVENRIVVTGVAGLLETDPNLTWDGSTLTVSGTGVAFTTGKVSIGNTNNSSIDHTMYILYGTTTNTVQTELFLDSLNSRIILDNNTTMMFEADIVGRDSTGTKHCAFKLSGVIDNTAGSTVLINNVSETIVAESVEAWSVVAQADNLNDTLVIKVIGEGATIIKWTAFVKTISITH